MSSVNAGTMPVDTAANDSASNAHVKITSGPFAPTRNQEILSKTVQNYV